jgi:hypothetical protein
MGLLRWMREREERVVVVCECMEGARPMMKRNGDGGGGGNPDARAPPEPMPASSSPPSKRGRVLSFQTSSSPYYSMRYT